MKHIVAVSGGVDSVVLLDLLSKGAYRDIIVAHFDHGIRDDSAEDERFVKALANQYGYHFESRREELGADAGETLARDRRYAFLRELAAKHKADILTAHHLDDLVETVAINLTRGTGWRGLAVLDSPILRPLAHMPKSTLLSYAVRHGLEWREDSTNGTDAYLRNRVRKQTTSLSVEDKKQIHSHHLRQKELKREIADEAAKLLGDGPEYSRYQLIHSPVPVALEYLYHITRGALTRPQLARALHAIKTAAAGSTYQAGSGVSLHFTTRYFSL